MTLSRPTGMARRAMRRSAIGMAIAGQLYAGLLCAGCSGGGGDHAGPHVPDVDGQQAHLALVQLRQSGYRHFSWAGRTSSKPVGTVLWTRPAAGTPTPPGVRIRLVMSQGRDARTSHPVDVPGIGTCDANSLPPGTPCAGGPVLLPIRR